jgi:L-ascorbate metabolism protein UlaG (beta-lactamase superfamily)
MPQTQLNWYDQSAFKITTPAGNIVLVDPWLTNPVFEKGKDEVEALRFDFAQATDTASRRDNVELTKQCRLGKMGTG